MTDGGVRRRELMFDKASLYTKFFSPKRYIFRLLSVILSGTKWSRTRRATRSVGISVVTNRYIKVTLRSFGYSVSKYIIKHILSITPTVTMRSAQDDGWGCAAEKIDVR